MVWLKENVSKNKLKAKFADANKYLNKFVEPTKLIIIQLLPLYNKSPLREKCPNTNIFWSVFSLIWTRKNFVFGYFSHSAHASLLYVMSAGLKRMLFQLKESKLINVVLSKRCPKRIACNIDEWSKNFEHWKHGKW